jgi:hypothetical protein
LSLLGLYVRGQLCCLGSKVLLAPRRLGLEARRGLEGRHGLGLAAGELGGRELRLEAPTQRQWRRQGRDGGPPKHCGRGCPGLLALPPLLHAPHMV